MKNIEQIKNSLRQKEIEDTRIKLEAITSKVESIVESAIEGGMSGCAITFNGINYSIGKEITTVIKDAGYEVYDIQFYIRAFGFTNRVYLNCKCIWWGENKFPFSQEKLVDVDISSQTGFSEFLSDKGVYYDRIN